MKTVNQNQVCNYEYILNAYLSELLKECPINDSLTANDEERPGENNYFDDVKSSRETALSNLDPGKKELTVLPIVMAGLKLAVDDSEIYDVIDLESIPSTNLPGTRAPSHVVYNKTQYALLDVSPTVIPMQHPQRNILLQRQLKKVLILKDSSYGIACEEVGEKIIIHAESVKWAGQKSSRSWLVGTLTEHRCALVTLKVLLSESMKTC